MSEHPLPSNPSHGQPDTVLMDLSLATPAETSQPTKAFASTTESPSAPEMAPQPQVHASTGSTTGPASDSSSLSPGFVEEIRSSINVLASRQQRFKDLMDSQEAALLAQNQVLKAQMTELNELLRSLMLSQKQILAENEELRARIAAPVQAPATPAVNPIGAQHVAPVFPEPTTVHPILRFGEAPPTVRPGFRDNVFPVSPASRNIPRAIPFDQRDPEGHPSSWMHPRPPGLAAEELFQDALASISVFQQMNPQGDHKPYIPISKFSGLSADYPSWISRVMASWRSRCRFGPFNHISFLDDVFIQLDVDDQSLISPKIEYFQCLRYWDFDASEFEACTWSLWADRFAAARAEVRLRERTM